MPGNKLDFFGMSDEDFTNINPSSLGSEEEEASASSPNPSEDETETKLKDEDDVDGSTGDDPAADGSGSGGSGEPEEEPEEEDETEAQGSEDSDKDEDESEAKSKDGKEPGKDDEPEAEDSAKKSKADDKTEARQNEAVATPSSKDMTPEQLAQFYDQVMAPFKANGREISLKSPDEAIRLMQMGAGYGRKLQDMQPHLKTLRMLEKNNLLDQNRLSFLIDIDQKNPEAIKKLLKDSGIDPLDLNMEDNANYRPRDHSVSDREVAFSEALKDVASQPGGRDTIQQINSTWDQASKDFLWGNPEVLSIIQEQRANGIYDTITAEIDRQKMLGEIAPSTPFLEAYKIAGDALVNSNSLNQPGSGPSSSPQKEPSSASKVDQTANKVLGTRTAAPKSSAPNSDKVKAAASTPSSSRKAKGYTNPLEMADDEFLKQFENRL